MADRDKDTVQNKTDWLRASQLDINIEHYNLFMTDIL